MTMEEAILKSVVTPLHVNDIITKVSEIMGEDIGRGRLDNKLYRMFEAGKLKRVRTAVYVAR